MSLETEAARRRTFAIISHPDAGKTTLTEKMLLFSGAIHLAGSVKARKNARSTVSDWMKMERERGISISSSVLQFDHLGSRLNLLDTPGHADFSEDTYRTLAAVDSAVMLIDHAKGVEARTQKLFDVCRMRKLPVVTWMNKLDREGLEPLGLLDDVSRALDLKVAPLTWPVGMGRSFRGVVDLRTRELLLFRGGGKKGAEKVQTDAMPFDEAAEELGQSLWDQVAEEIELVEMAGDGYDHEAFLAGETSPVFWGSAMTNFGVEPMLRFIAEEAARPAPRESMDGLVDPGDERFTGFIFKIQANMNPRHRDRIAFMRVVSGQFERDMSVVVGRSGEKLKLSKPHSFMANERAIVDDAWPGDIVGLHDPGKLRIGDTLSGGERIKFRGIPRFAPEHFARIRLKDPMRRKQLATGLDQLSHEGVIQLFYRPELGKQDPYLGAVGLLQFEVLIERLQNEYRVEAVLDRQSFRLARWVGGGEEALAWLKERRDYPVVEDRHGQPVVLADSAWPLNYALREAPGLELYEVEPL